MKAELEYRGYVGSAEVDFESGVLVGRLLFITDIIGYSANDVAGLRVAFEQAVDEYLQSCEELGDAPELPCKGSFNVRVGPERHRTVALAARRLKISLNDYVVRALDVACNGSAAPAAQSITVNVYPDTQENYFASTAVQSLETVNVVSTH